MKTLRRRVDALQTLTRQFPVDGGSNEGRLLLAIIETLAALADEMDPPVRIQQKGPAFVCPFCGGPIQIDETSIEGGEPLNCPQCSESIVIVNQDLKF